MKRVARTLMSNLRRKMTLAFSVVLVLLVAGLIAAGYRYVLGVSQQNAAQAQEQLMDKSISLIDTFFSEMDQMAQQIAGDSRIVSLFSSLQEDESMDNYFEQDVMQSIEIASILTTFSGPQSQFWRIHLYNQYGDHIYVGTSLNPGGLIEEHMVTNNRVEHLMGDLLSFDNHLYIGEAGGDRWSSLLDEQVCSLHRPISNYYYSEAYGVVEVQREISHLEELLALGVQAIDVYVFDAEGNQVLPEDGDYAEVENSSSHYVTQQSGQYGWSVALVQSRSQMTAPYQGFIWYLLIAGAGLIFLLMLVIYVIAGQISKPVVELSRSVEGITFNNMEGSIPAASDGGTTEVQQLNRAFAEMLKRLGDSLEYEKKSYLLALQSQMDPHFLYNALSVINALSLAGRNDDVSDACDKLSAMLRYNASFDTKATVLQDEIDHTRNYLDFMQLRFQDQLSYSVTMDPSLRNMPMPRQVIQPIVENCFSHGFKSVLPPWHVAVDVSREGDDWCIRVEDNGSGISREEIEALEEKVNAYMVNIPENYNEMKIGGLGLINTIMRLKLASAGQVDYRIGNREAGGTVVELRGHIHEAVK